jgi:outer membrane protein assembly factor BamB
MWPAALLTVILLLGAPRGAEACTFRLQQAQVVGYGELLSYPGLWNNEGSTVMVVDRKHGNLLLYPQMAPYAEFTDAFTNKTYRSDATSEVFMFLSPEGRPLWTAKAYGTTFPVVDEDVFILNERHIEKLAKETGEKLWTVALCGAYTSSQVKQVSDVFGVLHADSPTELAVGLLMTATGQCTITIGSESHNLTSAQPTDLTLSTPFIVYFNKGTGQAMRFERFDPLDADLVRTALRKDNATTFLGMVTANKAATSQRIAQYSADGRQRWNVSLRTPHPHNFLWSQSFADDENDHVLFITDPTTTVEINANPVKHKGLIFGGIDLKDGSILWKKTIPYAGVITSTLIQFMDEGLVLFGAIWDGEDDLDLGGVTLRKLRRPVQGMLGFLAIYDVDAQRVLFVQEVAPEMAYPGHHVGISKLPNGEFQIASCPAFWDEAPQRLVDNDHSVSIPRPDTDSVVLIRYRYLPCRGASGTSQGTGRRGQAARRIAHVLLVLVVVVFVVGVLGVLAMLLSKRGVGLPSFGFPNLFGRGGRGYGFLSTREEEDDDPFHDIDYENDPL